jgi:hypothetical protein
MTHLCRPAPARPNTEVLFRIVDTTKPPLPAIPSPLYRPAWRALLADYPGELPTILDNILEFGALLGYTGPDRYIISRNLKSAQLEPKALTDKIITDLALNRIREVFPKDPGPFISSPLGLTPKPNNKWRVIHHLSYPPELSVNDSIAAEAAYLKYTAFEDILAMVLEAGRHCTMVKRDMKDAFRMIPIAPHNQWLMGFCWEGRFYVELVLSFGLRTAPIIFNLFAEAFEWIVKSFSQCPLLAHYLDDFMAAFPAHETHRLTQFKNDYSMLCKALGILENDDKDEEGTLIKFLGRMVDSTTFVVSIPQDKVQKVITLTASALRTKSSTLLEAQQLAGLLSFCASAVQLGFVFCRRLWTFIATFKQSTKKSFKRRIPSAALADIRWWHDLFPIHNGMRFFDDRSRQIIHLFADASVVGMGAFFFDNVGSETCYWPEHAHSLPCEHALATQLPSRDVIQPFDINIFEIQAMLLAFEKWSHSWAGKVVFLHTDSATTQLGLLKQSLRAEKQNEPLRRLLLLAAQRDIKLEPRHLSGDKNGLADALSRDLQDYIANCCPHWQPSYHSLNRR